jgi:transposase
MVVAGVDAHKRTHTVVVVDAAGRKLGERTCGTASGDHLELLVWVARFGPGRVWAVEDCRHLSRRLERDLLAAGERIVRVPPKLMAHARDGARTYGKSDPIDALAVARAALREPDLPTAHLDGPARQLKLLADHREDLVAERTRVINRLRWHLHELDPAWALPARGLWRPKHLAAIAAALADMGGLVARLARDLAARCAELTTQILALGTELGELTQALAPALLAVNGCGTLTAAKIVGETAGITRFRSRHAYARHNGTAPLPVWSASHPRHRLSRAGNRQLNAALHRIAITQARTSPAARSYLQHRRTTGDTKAESIRALKRRLSDVIYRAQLADAPPPTTAHTSHRLT